MTTRRTFIASLPIVTLAVALGTQPATAQMVSRSGTFVGASNHETSGSVTLSSDAVNLGEDFALDSGPDPVVGLGKDGVYDPDTFMGELAELAGPQTYSLPDAIDPDDYNEVYIWCRAANVPLGVAALN